MKFAGEGNDFDVSDVEAPAPTPRDGIDTILCIANEVIGENAPAPSGTRIERLARFVVENLVREGDVKVTTAGSVSKLESDDATVCRVGAALFMHAPRTSGDYSALANPLGLAAALIRGTELACGD